MKIKQSSLRLLIREAIEQVFEAETQYQVGDRVKIDSSYGGGIGTVEMARHPFYAIKFDQTGTTDSFHFSDLRPFNDEEEDEKNANINTGLEEGEISFPAQLKGNDGIIWKKNWEKNNQANYGVFYKGHDIEHGGITFDSVNTLQRKVKSYVLSNNLYDKLKYAKPLDESTNPTDSISLDVPLFIRMLEYAREDAKTDMDLHNVTENALKLSIEGKTLTMSDYDSIVGGKSLKESSMDKIYHITGTLVVDDEKRNQKDILSDVRALPGVTIVRNIEMEQDPSSRYFRSTIEIKIDPYPYAKQGKFNDGTIQTVINNVKGINGVIGFKQTEDTYSTND